MQHIQTVTVGSGGAASITFSAIPATFTDLVLKVSLRTTETTIGSTAFLALNGVQTNQTRRVLFGVGSGSGSSVTASNLGVNVVGANSTSNTFGNSEIYIPNYRSTVAKSLSADMVNENNETQSVQAIYAGLFNPSTNAAITSIEIIATGNFVQHSSASLYGITAGSDGIVAVS